jgi:maleylacetate reductase
MRVRFGAGRLGEIAEEVDRLGLARVLVLSTPGHRQLAVDAAQLLGERAAGVHAGAVMHVPIASVEQARSAALSLRADCSLAIGGGSTIGLAKALALQADLPYLAVPTTYSGSEMTPVWGITQDGRKTTGRDPRVLPASVVYDPQLTESLPISTSVTSGINALAHAVEALYAPDTNPMVSLMAAEGARLIVSSLPAIAAHPRDPEARADALQGSWLCGLCLGGTTMALHHKLCHVLGGSFDLPHAPTHTVVLPHVLAYNAPAALAALAALRSALNAEDPALGLWELAGRLGAPRSLAELGLPHDALGAVVAEVGGNPYPNPRPVDHESLLALLERAWSGAAPTG